MDTILAALGLDAAAVEKLNDQMPEGVRVEESTSDATLPVDALGVVATSDSVEDAGKLAAQLGARRLAMLLLLGQAIDAREGISRENSHRVLGIATRFGEALNLDPDTRSRLQRGALLHDIGKLHLSNDVLLTKAMLTHEEWDLLRKHTVFGEEMVESTPGFEDVAVIARSHHENFDGTGYPDGLEGDAIPYLARIYRIIDVVASMTSPRHYRDGMASVEEAVEHLRTESGHHFEPGLVDVFIEHVVPAL